ncbi:MAG: twin-arginine translocase subunit TatB [Actinomycetia bacterium]|nr:twin-arginine translocase subunit TatB [Actinomycetes bacterium]
MPEWSEVLVILLVAMVVFGPHRLPAMARKAGRMVAEFRVAARELREGIEKELAVEEMREAAKEVMATTKDTGKELRTSLSDSEKALRSTPPLASPTDTKAGAQRSSQTANPQEGSTPAAATADPDNTEPNPASTEETGVAPTEDAPGGSPPNLAAEDTQPDQQT